MPRENPSWSDIEWAAASFTELHTLYGHTARVWDVKLCKNSIISVGEDALCVIWGYDGQVISKFKGHKGKGVWSLDADEERRLIVSSFLYFQMNVLDVMYTGYSKALLIHSFLGGIAHP